MARKIGTKSYYTKKLDALISQKVRSIGTCQRCGNKKGQMQCAHIISRTNRTLRWDLNNVLCLCPTCHFWAHQDPLGFTQLVQEFFPERYGYLWAHKDTLTQRSAKGLEELYEVLSGNYIEIEVPKKLYKEMRKIEELKETK